MKKLTEQQIVVGFLGIVSVIFFTLVAAKVIMAQYFVFTIPVWIEIINALLVLASNYLYLYRKAAAAGKNTSSGQGTSSRSPNPKDVKVLANQLDPIIITGGGQV
jgi:hypothetical protein